jgi:hypothetical protein
MRKKRQNKEIGENKKQNEGFFALLLLSRAILSLGGCSKLFGPSGKEVIKSIDDSGLFREELKELR